MTIETITRSDPRYVDNKDPRAFLEAYLGGWRMGGWTDDNQSDFRSAVEDEALFGAGPDVDLTAIVISAVRRDEDDQ